MINKIDLAEYVGADLEVMRRDSALVREGKPVRWTNCRTGDGVDEVVSHLLEASGVGAVQA